MPPEPVPLEVLREVVQTCRGCDIYKCGTHAVFGEGAVGPGTLMFVGEQPGHQEELEGHPFVGPAGRILDKALAQAGIDRSAAYVTNAVKHFKFEPRGKRRIHSKPSAREAQACRPWLEREVEIVHPSAIVALGATAAQSLMGPAFRVTKDGGKVIRGTRWAEILLATAHPSSILRKPSDEERHAAFDQLVTDLATVARAMKKAGRK
jgi:uracil-DNA glycosylase